MRAGTLSGRLLLGLVVVLDLAAASVAAFLALKQDPTGRPRAETDNAALGRGLEEAYRGQMEVESECRFPARSS